MRRYIRPTIWLGILILITIVISLLVFPEWVTTPTGIFLLVVTAIIGVILFVSSGLSIYKDYFDLREKEDKAKSTNGQDHGQIEHADDVVQIGQVNLRARKINAETIVGTYIEHAHNVIVYKDPSQETPQLEQLVSQPRPLPEYYVNRKKLMQRLRNSLRMNPKKVKPSIMRRGTLVALQGIGGTGKTILAQSISYEDDFLDFFPDGMLWATLGPESTKESSVNQIVSDWIRSLGIDPTIFPDNSQKLGVLTSVLVNKQLLIVIDDVWDIDVALPLIQVKGRNCSLLLTTRDRELSKRIGITQLIDIDKMEVDEARELVSNRMGESIPESDWERYVEPLLVKLDWHPLAISLSAAQVSVGDISWNDILKALSKSAPFIRIDFEDAVKKEESLEVTFRISFESLAESDRRRFAWLTPLAPGVWFSLEDAASMFPDLTTEEEVQDTGLLSKPLIGEKREQVKDTLNRLYRRGLVEFIPGMADERFYRIHPLLHEYGLNLLREMEEYRSALTSHGVAYLLLISTEFEEGGPKFDTERSRSQWTLALNRAWDAYSKSSDKGFIFPDRYINAIVEILGMYWVDRGQYSELLTWANRALSISVALNDKAGQAEHLIVLGEAYTALGNFPLAQEKLDEAFKLAEEIGEEKLLSRCFNRLGNLYLSKNESHEAIKMFQEMLRLERNMGDRRGEGIALGNLGNAYLQVDDIDNAIEHLEEALSIAQSINDIRGAGKRFGNLGSAHLERGRNEIKKASVFMGLGLQIARYYGDPLSEGRQLLNLSSANISLWKFKLARLYAKESKRVLEIISSPEAKSAQSILDRLSGKLDDPIEFLALPEVFLLTERACMGDVIAEAQLRPTLTFIQGLSNTPTMSVLASRLIDVLDGERDYSVLSRGLPKDYLLNMRVLLVKLDDPLRGMFIDNLGNLIVGVLENIPEAQESTKQLIERIENSEDAPDFFSEELASSLRLLVDGERNPEIIVKNLNDEIQSQMFMDIVSAHGRLDIQDGEVD